MIKCFDNIIKPTRCEGITANITDKHDKKILEYNGFYECYWIQDSDCDIEIEPLVVFSKSNRKDVKLEIKEIRRFGNTWSMMIRSYDLEGKNKGNVKFKFTVYGPFHSFCC